MKRISYEDAQHLLHKMIDEGDPDTITAIFEHAFAVVKDGTASYDSQDGEIEYEADPEIDGFWEGEE